MTPETLEEALETLGELLTEREFSVEIAVVGGGSLLLLGLLERPTKDLDVVAIVTDDIYRSAEPLPEVLQRAVVDVARALGLAQDWLNAGPTSLLDFGLPDGFRRRATIRRFGNLVVQVASRYDQICFKLYAAVDQGPSSKHAADLRTLRPTDEELTSAAEWCRCHDPSDGFASLLSQALAAFGAV